MRRRSSATVRDVLAHSHGLEPAWKRGASGSQWNASICFRESPTSESPCRSAWSRKVNAWSFASVTSQSESLARSTATGFLSTP